MNTFARLADLEVEIDSYTLKGLQGAISPEHTRHTTEIELHGAGLTGMGEDVVYQGDEQIEFQQRGPILDLSRRRTIAEFCELIEQLDLFPVPPTYAASPLFRIWAFESAALDLALQQADKRLSDVLGIDAQPMRYVASTRLGDPPTVEPVTKRLGLDPTLRFKLDATSSWTPGIFEQLVKTGAVDSIDFKGRYRGTMVDQRADATLYQRVVEAFPDAWLEDPDLSDPAAAAVLAGEHDRITWDAPIHGISDIEALPFAPKMVNIKPSRVGHCASSAPPTTTAQSTGSARTVADKTNSMSAAGKPSTSQPCSTRIHPTISRHRPTTRLIPPPDCHPAHCSRT